MMEAVLILATIAQRYELVMAPGQTIKPHAALTLRPKPNIRMTLTARPAAVVMKPVGQLQAA